MKIHRMKDILKTKNIISLLIVFVLTFQFLNIAPVNGASVPDWKILWVVVKELKPTISGKQKHGYLNDAEVDAIKANVPSYSDAIKKESAGNVTSTGTVIVIDESITSVSKLGAEYFLEYKNYAFALERQLTKQGLKMEDFDFINTVARFNNPEDTTKSIPTATWKGISNGLYTRGIAGSLIKIAGDRGDVSGEFNPNGQIACAPFIHEWIRYFQEFAKGAFVTGKAVKERNMPSPDDLAKLGYDDYVKFYQDILQAKINIPDIDAGINANDWNATPTSSLSNVTKVLTDNELSIEEVDGTYKIIGYKGNYYEKNITLPNTINSKSVTAVDSLAFNNPSLPKLETVDIPASIKSIGTLAFAGTPSLAKVIINGADTEILKADAFKDCKNVNIIAPVGSKAEEFATTNKINFIPLNADGTYDDSKVILIDPYYYRDGWGLMADVTNNTVDVINNKILYLDLDKDTAKIDSATKLKLTNKLAYSINGVNPNSVVIDSTDKKRLKLTFAAALTNDADLRISYSTGIIPETVKIKLLTTDKQTGVDEVKYTFTNGITKDYVQVKNLKPGRKYVIYNNCVEGVLEADPDTGVYKIPSGKSRVLLTIDLSTFKPEDKITGDVLYKIKAINEETDRTYSRGSQEIAEPADGFKFLIRLPWNIESDITAVNNKLVGAAKEDGTKYAGSTYYKNGQFQLYATEQSDFEFIGTTTKVRPTKAQTKSYPVYYAPADKTTLGSEKKYGEALDLTKKNNFDYFAMVVNNPAILKENKKTGGFTDSASDYIIIKGLPGGTKIEVFYGNKFDTDGNLLIANKKAVAPNVVKTSTKGYSSIVITTPIAACGMGSNFDPKNGYMNKEDANKETEIYLRISAPNQTPSGFVKIKVPSSDGVITP